MKTAQQLFSGRLAPFLICFGLLSAQSQSAAQQAATPPFTLKRAVDLALKHSPTAAQADADAQRAYASYREARDQYIPQLLLGSGLGDSWGYPLTLGGTAPSLFNLTAQSALFNPALRQYIKAARMDFRATLAGNEDRHNQITQDTTLTYLELIKWQQMLNHFRQQQGDALTGEEISEERIREGVDTEQQLKQAKLVTARAHLRLVEAQGNIDTLRETLSQLTGLPVAAIDPVPESVPTLPPIPSTPDATTDSVESNPAVRFAEEHAEAQAFQAKAEHRSLWPSVDFASQYAVLAKFNNWIRYFPAGAFQRNNASLGVVIRFPFFNASQHAHAEAADASALSARTQVQTTKNQVSEQILKLQRSVQQLSAAKEVSELEYEIAQSNSNAVEVKMNSGTATVHDAENARTEMSEKYNALQDSDWQLLRARIGLLRATNELQSWVEQGK